MANFFYTALNASGGEQQGNIEADNAQTAAAQLRGQNLFILEVKPAGRNHSAVPGTGGADGWNRWLPVFAGDKINFFRQFALLLRSGHTIVQALDLYAQFATKRGLSLACLRMSQQVKNGARLADAFEQESLFSSEVKHLITAGEESGELERVLVRLAHNMERRRDLKNQLITVSVYPSIVFLASIAVLYMVIAVVVPKFARFFAARQTEMPPLTQLLIDISNWVQDYGGYVSGGFLVFIFVSLAAYTQPAGKRVIDRFMIMIPLIGTAIRDSSIAQASITLSMLLRSGLSILDSLRIGAKVVSNDYLSQIIYRASEQILKGQSFAQSMIHPSIPGLVTSMIDVGERSGELSEVLDELGEFYSNQLAQRIKFLTTFIEPAMILFVGGIVAFVYFAIFQAIFQASTGG
jgi:type IV pilus assembly protein PilC